MGRGGVVFKFGADEAMDAYEANTSGWMLSQPQRSINIYSDSVDALPCK